MRVKQNARSDNPPQTGACHNERGERLPLYDRIESREGFWCPWCGAPQPVVPYMARVAFLCLGCGRRFSTEVWHDGTLTTTPVDNAGDPFP